MEKNEIVQKEKLDIYCSNCHFYWNLTKRKDNFNTCRLEKKLLLDIKYEPIETVAAFTLLAYVYYEANELEKASEYARKALCVSDIANVLNEWHEDNIMGEDNIKNAKVFNNNARKYIALSVYLHILYKIKDWKEMVDYFHKINTITLTEKDQCQIQLIKGYAYKKISPPSEPEALDCFVLAQSFDPDEPEAIFQEAIVREKVRCIEDNFISPLSQEERTALEKAIKLSSNRKEYKAYPETLLVTARLGDKIHQLLELEKQNGTFKVYNPNATNAVKEENYFHIKYYAQKIKDLYRSFKPHFRYVNRAYFACIRAMKNLCFIYAGAVNYRDFIEMKRLIIEKALINHSDDPTLTYQAGACYLTAYKKNKEQCPHYFYKAKSYFQKSMDTSLGNKWAELRLLEFEQNEHDVKIITEQLLQKYKDSSKKDRSGLHFSCAKALEKFQNSKSQAKFYYFEAIKLNPDNRYAMPNLLCLIGDADDIDMWFAKAKVYILSGLESKDYLEKAYSNIKRVYAESRTYQSVARYYCEVLIYKFKNTKEFSYLDEAMEIVKENESQHDMIDLKIKIYMHLAEISKESNTKLQNTVLAGRCGSIDGCKQSLAIMESLSKENNHYFSTEEAYKCCAVVDLQFNTNHKVRNDAVQVEEISKRIRLLLKLDDSDLLSGNKDHLHFRRKRYEMCCSYEEIVGYNIGDDSKEENNSRAQMAEEFFMLEAENVLLFTRILLDRAFKTFCKKYYSGNIKGKDVYYPTLSEMPDSIDSARDDMLEYLHEKYGMEGFQSKFPELLKFLANHQKYIDGDRTVNNFLTQYVQFSNKSKHEKSITSNDFMKKIKKLFPSSKDSPAFLAFVQTACVYTEDVVSELSKAEPSSPVPGSDLANDSAGMIQSTDQKQVVIFGDSFIENIGSKWENKEFALRRVISDLNKSALECMVSVKEEEEIYDVEYIVVQLGINDVLKETDKSVANLAWKVLPILNKFMQASNTNVKLLIGGVPEVKLPEPTGDGSKNNILSNFNEIVQKGCVFIPDTSFVANTKFHYGENGHIVKDDDTSYKLTEKGKTLWIRNVLNRIKKM